jgi:3-methyladenine DNA glycosylase AlkD
MVAFHQTMKFHISSETGVVSMQIEKLAREIRQFCIANSDEAQIKKYARFFVEGYDAFGIPQNVQENQRDLWLKEYKDEFGLEGFLQLGDLLVATGKYEEASFAIWFVDSFNKQFTPAILERVGQWLDHGICNWAHADVLSGKILSGLVSRKIVPFTAFAPWRTAESKWKRRVIPVSLIKPLPQYENIQDVLDFLAPMMLQPEKVVHQGLGWFLREAWKMYPQPVEEFLLAWKEKSPRVIFQYATEKMTPEQKDRFRRSKNK